MSQPQVINTLSDKKREIEAHIGSLERELEQARRDLSAVLATIKVFSGEGPLPTAYMNLSKVFPRHVLPKLCKASLEASQGPLSTREIAAYVIKERELDAGDRHLRKAVTYKVVQIMRRWELEGQVSRIAKTGNAVVWAVANLSNTS